MQPTVTVSQGGAVTEAAMKTALAMLRKSQVYVGIPETTAMDRKRQLMSLASSAPSKRKSRLQGLAVSGGVNNAQLVYIHTHGSPLKRIPARPIIEPAINDPENKAKITDELGLAAKAGLDGRPNDVTKYLNLSGQLAENLVRAWFVNPKNHWAPNAASTVRRKKSDKPLIDTGAMRKAITYVVSEEI
jgi:hypothetical protein